MTARVCAIHQPNYIPWAGYFNKIANADVFVFLDTVDYSKGAPVFKRNFVKMNGRRTALSIPSGPKQIPLNRIEVPSDRRWIRDHLKSLQMAYAKAPHYEEFVGPLRSVYEAEYSTVVALNIAIVRHLCRLFSVTTETVVESALGREFGTKNERLINLCLHLDANVYLSGTGARKYNDEDLFGSHGIALVYQRFKYPEGYPQVGEEFVEDLSVLDMLFNLGPDATAEIVKQSSLSE